MSSPVRLSIKDFVAELTIDRPEALNALNGEVLSGIEAALDELPPAPVLYSSVRVLVFRGAGPKAFAAGADIKLMQQAAADPSPENRAKLEQFIGLGQRVMRKIEDLPLPSIAVIHGFAIGGGLELALACDLIVAAEEAKLGQAEVNLGLIPGFGGTQRLSLRVGSGGAKRLILTGDPVSGGEAYRIGLADYLAPAAGLEPAVAKLCVTLAERSPAAIASAKRAIDARFVAGRDWTLKVEVDEFLKTFASDDAKEGLAAFVEKRKPKFTGG